MDGKFGLIVLLNARCFLCFEIYFVAIQGTLLDSKSLMSSTTARALKEASSRGVKIIIATGKVRSSFDHFHDMILERCSINLCFLNFTL